MTGYLCVQVIGAYAGVGVADLMFDLPAFGVATTVRAGPALWLGEVVASFGLLAVTLARAFTDTIAGIRPVDVPGFLLAQLVGAAAATLVFPWLVPPNPVPRSSPP